MAVALAWVVFGMPATMVAGAGGLGVIFGLLRIAWIIVASIFLYNVAVETGQFRVMKESIAALSTDKRLQLILIAFCFGAFLEGTGGGGAPVAIAGSFLIGLGFDPFQAATLCLIANTAPVAWGAVGNPIRVLAGVTDLPEHGAQRHDRTDPAPDLGDPPALAGPEHGRLARDPRGLAGTGRQRPLVRRGAVLLVELSGFRAGRHRRRPGLARGDGRVPQGLAAEDDPGEPDRAAGRRRSNARDGRHSPPSPGRSSRAGRHSCWPRCFIFVWATADGRQLPDPGRPEAADALPASGGRARAAGRAEPTPEDAIADLNILARCPARRSCWARRSRRLCSGMSPGADRPDLRPDGRPA